MTYAVKKRTEEEIEIRKQLRRDFTTLMRCSDLPHMPICRGMARKNLLHLVYRIENAFHVCSLLELECFVRLMKDILDAHPELERCKYRHQWDYAVHMAKNRISKKMEGIHAFYVVDRKGCAECNIHTLPTMESLIDFITAKSGSILQLYNDLLKGRYVVIGGRKLSLEQEIIDIKLEVSVNL